jgi:hypothetical protein
MRRTKMNSMETIALEQADLLNKLTEMNKKLINELAQYKAMDKEERVLEDALKSLDTPKNGG